MAALTNCALPLPRPLLLPPSILPVTLFFSLPDRRSMNLDPEIENKEFPSACSRYWWRVSPSVTCGLAVVLGHLLSSPRNVFACVPIESSISTIHLCSLHLPSFLPQSISLSFHIYIYNLRVCAFFSSRHPPLPFCKTSPTPPSCSPSSLIDIPFSPWGRQLQKHTHKFNLDEKMNV